MQPPMVFCVATLQFFCDAPLLNGFCWLGTLGHNVFPAAGPCATAASDSAPGDAVMAKPTHQ